MAELVFLKLGGSLITDKTQVEAARPDVLARLAEEVQQARLADPGLRLVLGHGSGSFGHVAARRYDTRSGVRDPKGWYGFAQVADAAARLDRLVVRAFLEAGAPVWSIQPSAGARCRDGKIVGWDVGTFRAALARGLVPMTYGDAVLDEQMGGTIASTEELFAWLTQELRPARIVLAGTVDGIYTRDPLVDPTAQHWAVFTPADLPQLGAGLGGSHGVDVTGGMLSKVSEMCRLVAAHPGLQVRLVSGLRPGAVQVALLDGTAGGGTVIQRKMTKL